MSNFSPSPRPTREQVDAAPARYRRALVDEALVHADDLADWSAKVDRQVLAAEVRALRAELDTARVASEQIAEWRSAEHVELVRLRAVEAAARKYIAGGLHDEFMAALGIPGYGDAGGGAARTPQPTEPGKTSTPRRDDYAQEPKADGTRRWPDRADREGHGADQAAGRGHRPAALAERERIIGALFEAADSVLERLDHGHGPVDMDDIYVGDLRDARDELEDWHAANVLPAPLPAVPDGEDAACMNCGLPLGPPEAWGQAQVGPVHHGCPDDAEDGEDVPVRLEAVAIALAEFDWLVTAGDVHRLAQVLREHPEVRAAVAAALARPTGGEQ